MHFNLPFEFKKCNHVFVARLQFDIGIDADMFGSVGRCADATDSLSTAHCKHAAQLILTDPITNATGLFLACSFTLSRAALAFRLVCLFQIQLPRGALRGGRRQLVQHGRKLRPREPEGRRHGNPTVACSPYMKNSLTCTR